MASQFIPVIPKAEFHTNNDFLLFLCNPLLIGVLRVYVCIALGMFLFISSLKTLNFTLTSTISGYFCMLPPLPPIEMLSMHLNYIKSITVYATTPKIMGLN